jgi:ribosomal protein S27E
MSEECNKEIKEKFDVKCKYCGSSNVTFDFWTGSHGDSGYLHINCDDCNNFCSPD